MDLVILNNFFFYVKFFQNNHFLTGYFTGLKFRISINSNFDVAAAAELYFWKP